jgi:predicted nucleic acid-binding protein
VGTFAGVLFCYGIFGPLSVAIGKQNEAGSAYFGFLRMAALGYVKGLSPILAAEMARYAIPTTLRPTFKEMETACRGERRLCRMRRRRHSYGFRDRKEPVQFQQKPREERSFMFFAATALLYDAKLVTNNPGDYLGVPGLRLLPRRNDLPLQFPSFRRARIIQQLR